MNRRKLPDRRQPGPTPRFPFRDDEGHWVCEDRRKIASRRMSDFDLDPLWEKVQDRHL
jgi:hypothetical protein